MSCTENALDYEALGALALKNRGLRLKQIRAVISPTLRLKIGSKLGADFHIGLTFEQNVLNERVVINITRISH